MRTLTAIFLLAFYAVFALAAFYAFYPWKDLLADYIAREIRERGFSDAKLSVAAVGARKIIIKDIQLGSANEKIAISKLTATYDLDELARGRLHNIDMTGVDLTLRQDSGSWSIKGWGNSYKNNKDNKGNKDNKEGKVEGKQEDNSPFSLPLTRDYFDNIPADNITIKKSLLHVLAGDWSMEVPFDVKVQKNPAPRIAFSSDLLEFTADDLSFSGIFTCVLSLDYKN